MFSIYSVARLAAPVKRVFASRSVYETYLKRTITLSKSVTANNDATATKKDESETDNSTNKKESVMLSFLDRDGDLREVNAEVGESVLNVAIKNDIELEGACEGTLSCSTCHVIFRKEEFDKLESQASEEELDMLDLAYGLTPCSRLGCQIRITKDMDGWQITVPKAVSDARKT